MTYWVDGLQIEGQTSTDEDGGFLAEGFIPQDATPGIYTVMVSDGELDWSFEFTVEQGQQPAPDDDPQPAMLFKGPLEPGTEILFEGSGFTPDADLAYLVSDWGLQGHTRPDVHGGFLVQYFVPQDASPGNYTLSVTDGEMTWEFDFQIREGAQTDPDPDPGASKMVSLNYSYARAGDMVQITGQGFLQSETVIIWLLGEHGAVQFADPYAQVSDGYFTYEFLVTQDMEPGVYTVVIQPSHEEEVQSSINIVT